jgi:hypothetical protein
MSEQDKKPPSFVTMTIKVIPKDKSKRSDSSIPAGKMVGAGCTVIKRRK